MMRFYPKRTVPFFKFSNAPRSAFLSHYHCVVGITGEVFMNEHGDRTQDYTISVVQFGKSIPIFNFFAKPPSRLVPLMNSSEWSKVLWPGQELIAPTDAPPCGWENEKCNIRKS